MFWQTLWPLVLGFTISGALQAFGTQAGIQRQLGGRSPRSIVRASGYGMASSSCSYAASATAKSLFVKGADFVTSLVFMFASTNLVIEMGIVLLVLIGWQFVVGQFVGGFLMIAMLGAVGGWWFSRGAGVEPIRARLRAGSASMGGDVPRHTGARGVSRLRDRDRWADAARATVSDLTMVRREIVIGFVVAGLLVAAVPNWLWRALFLQGHGFWTTVENALVGPVIALLSFTCSIGNVPLAATLWRGGITFGGVISFLFADLIAVPLLLVYRRYYGTRLTLRMLVLFWATMAAAGLVTDELFRAAGWLRVARPTTLATSGPSWDPTTWLDLVALVGLAAVVLASRRAGHGNLVTDPVCGMAVNRRQAPATAWHEGQRIAFCSEGCRERFLGAAARGDGERGGSAGGAHDVGPGFLTPTEHHGAPSASGP